MLPLAIEVRNGVAANQSEAVAAKVRAIQARFPGDELVEVTQAEAELDAGHSEAAEAAADRALKVAPGNTDAMVLKGRAIAERAARAGGEARHGLFEQARKIFIAANKLDTEDPEPLMEFYKTFVSEGVRPTPNAIAALHYSSDLAPQDKTLRMNSALQYLASGKVSEGRRALAPIAYDPHGGDTAKLARQVIAKVQAGDVRGALLAAEADADTQPSDR